VLTRSRDDGSVMLLIIGCTAIAATLIVVGVQVSKVFLARRALSATADSAALAATEGLDRGAIYGGHGVPCGRPLPLSRSDAARRAGVAVDRARPSLRHTFVAIGPPVTSIRGGTVTVDVTGRVRLPFGTTVRLRESASARSPVIGAC